MLTNVTNVEQARAELGQAQLKLGLGFTSTNLHRIARELACELLVTS